VPETPGLLCVHAHPDDEVILTGGALRSTADRGLRTGVVTCTGGEEGEIVGEGMVPEELRPRLGEIRHAELEAALDILDAGPPRLLGYRDSGMMGEASNDHPESLWRADFDEAVGRLVGHIREFRPDVLVTYDAYGGYGHPDHVQAHRLSLVAAEAAGSGLLYPDQGPAWRVRKVYLATIARSAIAEGNRALRELGLPSPFGEVDDPAALEMGAADDELGAVLDVMPWIDVKWRALRVHASQIGPDSFFLNVPEVMRDLVFGREFFIRYRSDVRADGMEDDLFAGLL
jgi:N-acetyl-1-D-myo-inositol-2-amino-2-deoxy-alpha-D-glucopyranoside deacetylase